MVPRVRVESVWSEEWRDPASWLSEIEAALRLRGMTVIRGGDFDRWDLELRRGLFASTKLMLAIEEHGGGRQLARIKMWPRFSRVAGLVGSIAIVLAALALDAQQHAAAILLGGIFAVIAVRTLQECASTMHDVAMELRALATPAEPVGDGERNDERLVDLKAILDSPRSEPKRERAERRRIDEATVADRL